jgi:hypothetical protein
MRRLLALVLLPFAGLLPAGEAARADAARPRELNLWPLIVERHPPGAAAQEMQALGPLFFARDSGPGAGAESGWRPLFTQATAPGDQRHETHFLFPLFSLRHDPDGYRWSLFELARGHGGAPGGDASARERELDLYPFWFQRTSAQPDLNYRALFPVYGTLRNKFWLEEASWTLFPLHAEVKRRGATTTYLPWPFVQVTRGTRSGWSLWPLYGTETGPEGTSTHVLWPLGFTRLRPPPPEASAGTPPRRNEGFLPFYATASGPGFLNEDFLWPFFGRTRHEAPLPAYTETRYLWPLFVQGRGDQHTINRWAPFYSHSHQPDAEKTWILWPLWRAARWRDHGVLRERHQFLYLPYWRETQRRPDRPTAPAASLTHLWPLWSGWDNGAGQRQWQFLSPLEPLLPGDPRVRRTWAPLFALARHENPAPGRSRTSLLWDAVTWQVDKPARHREFHLGPLLGVVRNGEATRLSLGAGLLAFHRSAGGVWRLTFGDFERAPPAQP